LGRLVEAEIVYQRGVPPQAYYFFKHALIRDAAYESLLKSTRQHYHQRIAHILEEQFPETTITQPELVAHHYTEAGLPEKAVHYWYQAGQSAIERSAHVEAIAHLRQGLALLQTLPETPQRLQREVDMLLALGASLLAVRGYAAAEVRETYTYAWQLCHQHRASTFLHGEDAGVVCRSHDAHTLWLLGYPDQGLVQNDEAVTLAQQIAYPSNLSFVLSTAPVLHHLRREWQTCQEYTKAAIILAQEQGFPYWMAQSAILHGWTLVQQGQAQAGIEQITQGLIAFRTTGAELVRPYYLALLSEAYGTMEQPEAGLTVLAEALTLAETTGERWYESEIYRLKGELLLQQHTDNQAEAENCFHHALEIARSQQAKSFELRAATSLSKLWQQQGKRQEAHDLLAPVYNWFTEGFETADLKDAKTLLDELAEKRS
jgi:tetratricopeptide (TPR) repeat protein